MKRILHILDRMDITPVELFIAGCLLSVMLALCSSVVYIEKVKMPATFQAWCKQTGNERNLTYKEWRLLIETRQIERVSNDQ